MKRIYNIITCTLLGTLLFTSCADEEIIKRSSLKIKEGVPVELKLNFTAGQQNEVTSRVVQTLETEYRVNSLFIYIFDGNGDVEYKQQVQIDGGQYNGTNSSGKITTSIAATSGYNKKIYAIANIDQSGDNVTMDDLEAIEKEADLLSLHVTLKNSVNVNRASFLMSGGILNDDGTVSSLTISDDAKIYDGSNEEVTTITLQRVDARITFEVTANITAPSGTTIQNVSFNPSTYEVHQLPTQSHLFGSDRDSHTFASMDGEEGRIPQKFDEIDQDGTSTFNFYMYENHQDVPSTDTEKYITADRKTGVNNKAQSLYALREQREKIAATDPNKPGMREENGAFVFAPENATYVIIKGELIYEQVDNSTNQSTYVNAYVVYTVHLGETGDDADDPTLVNNYTVSRNTHYTYKMTITGIDSYDMEVNHNEEVRPGAEGDVIKAGGEVASIDSHFGRRVFKLEFNACKDGLSWAIQTPFDKGIKVASATETSLKDYKWIQFAINKEFGITKNSAVKYPGYEAYDGGAPTQSTQTNARTDVGNGLLAGGTNASNNSVKGRSLWKTNVLANDDNNWYNTVGQTYNITPTDDACLRDVNQLLNHLREEADKYNSESDINSESIFEQDSDGKYYVYVTAFIDEYNYIYNPTTDEYEDPGAVTGTDAERRLKLWKEVVNGTDRIMHICTGDSRYSQDGASSWSTSVITFKQYPIYSVYNEKDPDIATAWGTEVIMETGRLPIGNPTVSGTMKNTKSNGRVNTLNLFTTAGSNGTIANDTKWDEVLRLANSNSYLGEDELTENYNNIWYACVSRNRDLNGNNIIDPEEMRWFLASIDELTDLWIGEDAMVESAKMYAGDGSDYWHYVSSSYNTDAATDPWIIWAEEGASRGAASASYQGSPYYYRCVRYLGLSLANVFDTPEDFAQVTPTGEADHYKFDLSKLGSWAKRTVSDEGKELPEHYERGTDDMNKPYSNGFEVNITPEGVNGAPVNWDTFFTYYQQGNMCPTGYRVPNQRELMLMYTRLNSEHEFNVSWSDYANSYWCATQFSFNGKGLYTSGNRPGFLYRGDSNNMILETNTYNNAYVRCVKDNK